MNWRLEVDAIHLWLGKLDQSLVINVIEICIMTILKLYKFYRVVKKVDVQ